MGWLRQMLILEEKVKGKRTSAIIKRYIDSLSKKKEEEERHAMINF